jgi:hypothetical protein
MLNCVALRTCLTVSRDDLPAVWFGVGHLVRGVDQQALAEYRGTGQRARCWRGSPLGEVARRYGTSRQSLDAWRKWFLAGGVPGLTDRSRRPRSSPRWLSAELEALVCRLPREHPRWGARQIVHERACMVSRRRRGKATVHRVLVRNGLV